MNTTRVLLAIVAALVGMLLAIPVLALMVPFWAVAFLTRTVARLIEPRFVPWQQLIEFDPQIGWKPKANLDTYYLAERDDVFHVTTDSEGWSGKTNIAESHVVIFGDSYAFGYGVDAEASFANLSKVPVKAIGAPGYNLVQELLLMRQLSSQLKGKLVVWFIYFTNDLFDNLSPNMRHYRTPFVREAENVSGWEIVTSHLSAKKWSYSSGRQRIHLQALAAVYSPTFLSQRASAACEFLIKEGNDICNLAGAQLLILTIPCPYTLSQSGLKYFPNPQVIDPELPDREIREICRKWRVPLVAGKDFLSEHDYKGHDDHWNERGHRRVAQALERLYRNHLSGALQKIQIVTCSPDVSRPTRGHILRNNTSW
jgi:hypothetical protein